LNDITPHAIACVLKRKVIDIKRNAHKTKSYVYDRGKEFEYAEYISPPPSTIKVCTYDNLQDEEIITDTSNWSHQHGRWFDPFFEKAKISKLTTTLMQSDSGANRVVTDQLNLLENVTFIKDYPMGGCNKEEVAITCTAKGKLKLYDKNNNMIRVDAYYSKDVDGTIVSPTTIIRQHSEKFSSYIQHSDCDTNTGYIKLIGRADNDNFELQLTCRNDLWYHALPCTSPSDKATINKMSSAASYELWHQRTAHVGQRVLLDLHQHATGVPKLYGNAFYKCSSCMTGKLCTKRINKRTKTSKSSKEAEIIKETPIQGDAGQHFHIDFGFVRGREESYDISTDNLPRKKGKIVQSIDGHSCYVIVIDRVTRYTWIFLSKTKQPPVATIKQLLTKFKSDNPNRTVRTDQGGELGHSTEFSNMIAECGFTLEETGSDASSQNGMAERPNRTYGQMMRCMLHSAELGPEFWSFALIYAVYIRNRLYHTSLNKSPYEKMTGNKPDLSGLRIFGCRIFARRPGQPQTKLDHHTSTGIFLGFTATNKNARYIDENTGTIKVGTHIIYDEACMTLPSHKTPIAAQTLQILGYSKEPPAPTPTTSSTLKVQKLNDNAITPIRSTAESVGYDLHCNLQSNVEIHPQQTTVIPTGIAIEVPTGTYAKIAPRSGLTVKRHITTMAGIIDPDYRGDIKIVLHNFGSEIQTIKPNDKIAQMILERVATPDIEECSSLTSTERATSGFGSTDKIKTPSPPIQLPTDDIIQYHRTTTAAAATINDPTINKLSIIPAYFEPKTHLYLSTDPFDNVTTRTINIKRTDNNLLGMRLTQCKTRNLPKLLDCDKGSSSIRLPLWRSQLRNAYITHINDIAIYNITQIESIIQQLRKDQTSLDITFATIDKQNLHPQFGVPILYHDQMNIIAKHLWELNHQPQWQKQIDENIITPYVLDDDNKVKRKYKRKVKLVKTMPTINIATVKTPKKLTRRYLLKQDDWEDWQKSEYKQLDQYKNQNTLGTPTKLPQGANLLPLLWTYLIKDDGTKKARCVCNGSPKMRGSVTLANTYAGSLEQTGSRIFWAISAMKNYITIGADASNAFAEAPAPKAPLFVSIDQPYREWYAARNPDSPKLPKDSVLPVYGALQGHPEAARLWAKLIDKIIKDLGLKATTHEPCLYNTENYNNTGKSVLFLRQVDDFAIACEDKDTALHIISAINDKMTIDVKQLGLISRFNGVDILQSRHYVKLYNKTYIEKIAAKHPWLQDEPPLSANKPIPMNPDPKYQRKLEQAEPGTENEIKLLERRFNFGYRQAIGELIYAMITCRPDISYSVIKLSQYSTKASDIHFEAVKQIYKYLWQTKDDGITYWRKEPRMDLPIRPAPAQHRDENYNYYECNDRQVIDPSIMNTAVDSDYAGDQSHRKSVTGLSIQLAGGTILYKTRYQDTIALSSTEAEFTAAAEAGKYILYTRSILDELGIDQTQATTLYEDNQGALLMANAQQPTKRTRHMDIKTFALQEWCEKDLIILHKIHTTHNWSDALTKAQGRILFYRHMYHIMGTIIPQYSFKMLGLNINEMKQSHVQNMSLGEGVTTSTITPT
jgi:dUTP pyrophosphatase